MPEAMKEIQSREIFDLTFDQHSDAERVAHVIGSLPHDAVLISYWEVDDGLHMTFVRYGENSSENPLSNDGE